MARRVEPPFGAQFANPSFDAFYGPIRTKRLAKHCLAMTPDGAAPDVTTDAAPALHALLAHLRNIGYRFVTPTPATHRRVVGRPDKAIAQNLRDVFGWSLPFTPDLTPDRLLACLTDAGVVETVRGQLRSRVRVSSLDGELFLHSAFPPSGDDAVFFGPDTYRFARFLESAADGREVAVAVDVAAGSGAGAAVVAKHFHPRRLIATDLNPTALRFAAINLAAAGVSADLRQADGLAGFGGPADLIVANPPFIAGDGGRTYRDGGDLHGARLSLDWTLAGARLLAPEGRLLLYAGSAIIEGRDRLHDALQAGLDPRNFDLDYTEIDPDIFGGQLASPAYRDAERIAAIGAVITRRP